MLSEQRKSIGRRLISGFLFLIVCCCAVSCKQIPEREQGGELLHRSAPPPDTVGVDVYFVRIPFQDRELLRQLWSEVDEQFGSPSLRRELMDQGLRIGIQGVALSPTLATLINATAAAPPTRDPTEISVAELQKDPIIRRQYWQMAPGMQILLRPYRETVPEMPLFWSDGGQFCGKTFKDAQGLIGVVTAPLKDGKVRFTITPEVVHGSLETKYKFESGVMFPEIARPKHIFHNLSLSLDLLPGQWIVIGPVSEHCSGIGRCFFIQDVGGTEQKVILLRLARTPRDIVFENTPLPEINPVGDSQFFDRN